MSTAFTEPLELELVQHPLAKRPLYHHQALMLDLWESTNSLLLVTKTGTGKTCAAFLPLLLQRQRAIAVYPTNALIQDQVTNISNLARDEGISTHVWIPPEAAGNGDDPGEDKTAQLRADVVLVPIDGARLEQWRVHLGMRTKSEALVWLLEADRIKIILTNPDILFLIFSLRFRAETLAAVSSYGCLVADEFHLYTGVELVHALMMVHFGRCINAFQKVVLLSATPDRDVLPLIQKVIQPTLIDSSARSSHPVIGKREAVHRVELMPISLREDVVETALSQLLSLLPEIRRRRAERPELGYVPAVVVLNSVVDAIRFEDRLVERGAVHGFKPEDLARIRGLSSRKTRSVAGKSVVIGTSAIEVGIDFDCDWLIFQASEAASFMQRFGRIGRHADGAAIILCPQNVLLGMAAISGGIDRAAFEDKVGTWYSSRQAYGWFTASFHGLVTARSVIESVLLKLQEDRRVDQEEALAIIKKLDDHWQAFAEMVGAEQKNIEGVRRQYARSRSGKRNAWMRAYTELNTFRTSLPTEWVHDYAEAKRPGSSEEAEYEADIGTLLSRAEGLQFNKGIPNRHGRTVQMGMLTVKGYGRWRAVRVLLEMEGMTSEDTEGSIYSTSQAQKLMFVQDSNEHPTPVSHVMSLQPHVFALFPRSISDKLDWRLPRFPCGDRIVLFDGAALLACAILEQNCPY